MASGTTAALAGGSGALAEATSYLSGMSTAASGGLTIMASPMVIILMGVGFLQFVPFL